MDARRRALLGALAALATKKVFSQGKVKLPAIGLGTWQTFDVGNDPAARAPLREVLKLLDGNVVDSSPMYGSAESVVGDLVAELGMRGRLFLATKVWASGREAGIAQMEASFKRLRVERMDLMQVHNLADVQVHAKTLEEMKARGRTRYMGVTHYSSSAYAEVERVLTSGKWDFLQINYSLAERECERRLLPLARERGLGVIVNRPFAEGSLFRRTRGKQLPPWAAEVGIASWAQYFLKWIVSHPAVTCAIPATSKPEHMKDNLGAAQGPLPDAAARKKMADYLGAL
ncbi:MAG: aldo/keto reductase [Betaproteobacteria bacterium RIFCSPLOWO2_12_FULL_68_19]|nr:MAG: aldo/keto reductase [Betaproteobacteria bacterium RIFCSPLOWO2_12_FULL_68_19]